jgi:RNA polymerase sigma factor (sigma-70 family)
MRGEADIQELLTHAEWLRGLARHLVRDEADAADAVQQTWVAALHAPPDADRPARPWLAQVLRNFVRKNARTARNRGARELAVGQPEPSAPSSEALLESVQLQRLLGELVVALEEPYRSAILLRFYEGLEPARIAEALGVPAGTVRWRLSEGVARLRGALGKRMRGDRQWRLALMPLVSDPWTGKGALVAMSTNVKIALGAAVVAVSLVGGGLAWYGAGASGSASRLATTGGAGEPTDRVGPALGPNGQASSSAGAGRSSPAGQDDAAAALAGRKAPPPRFVATAPPPSGAAPAEGPPKWGTLPKEDIQKGVRAAMPAMKACYARLLQESPGAQGRLSLRFTIVERDGAGRISDASVVTHDIAGTLDPMQPRDGGAPELIAPATEACILEALAAAPFNAPVGGPVVVTYPVLFAPKPPPAGE